MLFIFKAKINIFTPNKRLTKEYTSTRNKEIKITLFFNANKNLSKSSVLFNLRITFLSVCIRFQQPRGTNKSYRY